MEKIVLNAPDTGEEIELYVLEQTTVTGSNYLLVAEDENEDGECYILKEVSHDETEELTYEFVEDETLLNALAKIFGELLEDTDIEV